jgi:hypothetical protein
MRGQDAAFLKLIVERLEASGVSHDGLISWRVAVVTCSEPSRSTALMARRLGASGVSRSANAARHVSCQIVTVDHLLPKVATLRNRCRWSALRMTLGNDQAFCRVVTAMVSAHLSDTTRTAGMCATGNARGCTGESAVARRSCVVGNAAGIPASTARPHGRRAPRWTRRRVGANMSLGLAKVESRCSPSRDGRVQSLASGQRPQADRERDKQEVPVTEVVDQGLVALVEALRHSSCRPWRPVQR